MAGFGTTREDTPQSTSAFVHSHPPTRSEKDEFLGCRSWHDAHHMHLPPQLQLFVPRKRHSTKAAFLECECLFDEVNSRDRGRALLADRQGRLGFSGPRFIYLLIPFVTSLPQIKHENPSWCAFSSPLYPSVNFYALPNG